MIKIFGELINKPTGLKVITTKIENFKHQVKMLETKIKVLREAIKQLSESGDSNNSTLEGYKKKLKENESELKPLLKNKDIRHLEEIKRKLVSNYKSIKNYKTERDLHDSLNSFVKTVNLIIIAFKEDPFSKLKLEELMKLTTNSKAVDLINKDTTGDFSHESHLTIFLEQMINDYQCLYKVRLKKNPLSESKEPSRLATVVSFELFEVNNVNK